MVEAIGRCDIVESRNNVLLVRAWLVVAADSAVGIVSNVRVYWPLEP